MPEKEIYIEPMTRIEGHLAIHTRVDVDKKVVTEAHSSGVMFRGFEVILEGRDPPDAAWITPRICGVCPTPHSLASVQCLDMSLKASPPPLATLIRNLAYSFEIMYDHPLHWFQLAGPDYSQLIVEKFYPSWWKEAQATKAEHSDAHGFATVADILAAMNPITGKLWLEALEYQKISKECLTMLGAKFPHVATFIPGGVTPVLTVPRLEELLFKYVKLAAWLKKFIFIADDVLSFVEKMGYGSVGVRPTNLISYGCVDDPEAYNAKYEEMSDWGVKRRVSPAVIIDGKVKTNNLVDIHLGIREYVPSSFYDEWDGREVEKDPLGNEVAKEHPWNKKTLPKPTKKDWKAKYSWLTSPRWESKGKINVVEAGPIARMWATAASKKVEGSTGKSLKFTILKTNIYGLPAALTAETEFEWKIPKKINTLERLRARVYYTGYVAHLAFNDILKVIEYVKQGKTQRFTKFERPKWSLGVGFAEAGRGALAHWIVVKDGKIHRYQIITPSNINASPRDIKGQMGPYEEALMDTPIKEEVSPDEWKGVDIVRVIRSMDPCLACSVSVYAGNRKFDRIIDFGGV